MTTREFWSLVDIKGPDECWPWLGTPRGSGYGQLWFKGKMMGAHCASYIINKGKIPKGKEVHHTCNTRICVNPRHLRAITRRRNLLESPLTWASINSQKTHCKHGHPFTPDNTYMMPGGRSCKTCRRRLVLEHRQRIKELGSDK